MAPISNLIGRLTWWHIIFALALAEEEPSETRQVVERDFKWPNRQLNVLVDVKSINVTEQQILAALFDQIQHKTCLKVNALQAKLINPFDTKHLEESEQNFVYIFKSHRQNSNNKQPALGLSSFGCLRQGRQSMVLTDLAFRWPELVLRYHILRSLGLERVERPDGEVKRLLNMLPLNQKIGHDEGEFSAAPSYFAYATLASNAARASGGANNAAAERIGDGLQSLKSDEFASDQRNNIAKQNKSIKPVQYLSERDLSAIKQLYNCTNYQNKLSVKPLSSIIAPEAPDYEIINKSSKTMENLYSMGNNLAHRADLKSGPEETEKKLDEAEASIKEIIKEVEENKDHKINETLIDEAAKSIVDYLLADTQDELDKSPINGDGPSKPNQSSADTCKPMQSCPLPDARDADRTPAEQRSMLLKLDPYHALDPQLQQANQMKLSQLNGSSQAAAASGSFGLLNAPDLNNLNDHNPGQSEMMISFEQADPNSSSNPIAALASSKVLKLCSCQCQTMSPTLGPPSQQPSVAPQPSEPATLPPATTPPPPAAEPTTQPPLETQPPETQPTAAPTTEPPATTIPPPPPEQPATEPPSPPAEEPTAAPELEPSSPAPPPPQPIDPMENVTESVPAQNLTSVSNCDQVKWVKPNKTVYGSSKIVWDVDGANQNYFICQNEINGELIPGKTHGFSCKLSSEGKAYEGHDFRVLTKPESVNLAWVQRNSDSFGTTNLPVAGGYSKQSRDPYVVSRCLVRGETNDVMTLIGYVNNQGVGWFPFDDIQIECEKYDVLACIS